MVVWALAFLLFLALVVSVFLKVRAQREDWQRVSANMQRGDKRVGVGTAKRVGQSPKQESFDLPTVKQGVEQEGQVQREFVIINLMALEGQLFDGASLLEVLVASGLRFGEGNLFDFCDDGEEVLFKVANKDKPYVFDYEGLAHLSTTGIFFAMELAFGSRVRMNFDVMYRVANEVNRALGGELRSVKGRLIDAEVLQSLQKRVDEFQVEARCG